MARLQIGKHPAPPRGAVGLPHEGDHGRDPRLELRFAQPVLDPLVLMVPELADKAPAALPGEDCAPRKQPGPQKIHPAACRLGAWFLFQLQLELVAQETLHGIPHPFQLLPVLRPDHHVVHVAHIGPAAQRLFDKAVRQAEVGVREMLAGQASDRQPPARRRGMRPHDSLEEIQQRPLAELSLEQREEHLMVDAIEILPDIHLQKP